MDTKVQILTTFHRFVSNGEGRPESKQTYPAGLTAAVPAADAADWIAKGLAKQIETPRPIVRLGRDDSAT